MSNPGNEESEHLQSGAQNINIGDGADDSAADSGFSGNTTSVEGGMAAADQEGETVGPEVAMEGGNIYRDKMTVNDAGLQTLLRNPLFTAMASSTIPNHVGYLNVELPSSKNAEIIVFRNPAQVKDISGPVMDLIQQSIKHESDVDVGTVWVPIDEERTIEGSGDGAAQLPGPTQEPDVSLSTNGGGDVALHAPGDSQSKDFKPEVVPQPPTDANTFAVKDDDVYQEVLAEKQQLAQEKEAENKRIRNAELEKLRQAIAEEKRKQAEVKAIEEVERAKKAEQEAHDKELADLKRQLSLLQNPPRAKTPNVLPPQGAKPDQPTHFQSGAPPWITGGMMPMRPSIASQTMQLQNPGAPAPLGLRSQSSAFQTPVRQVIPRGHMVGNVQCIPSSNIAAVTTPGVSPQKPVTNVHFDAASNRRSPRANISSLAYDATRKQEAPSVSNTATAHLALGGPSIHPSQLAAFSPLAASSPGKNVASRPGVMSPKGRKRPPSVTSNVLEQLLEQKRAKKNVASNVSPTGRSAGVGVPLDDLQSQSDLKYKLAKDLDVILKETLKQGNINKIRQRVENAGFQAIPLPEPMPKDLFCYAASLYVTDITETDPDSRAAVLRKNCLDFVVGQMFNFTKTWMTRYCADKQSDPFAWISKHQTADTKIDGLFVILMAAYLRKPIQILSHTDTWTSDANIAGPIPMIYAGDNEFTAVEVADRSYWAQLRRKLALEGPTLDVLKKLLATRNTENNTGGLGKKPAQQSTGAALSNAISDLEGNKSSKKKKKKNLKPANFNGVPTVPTGNATATPALRATIAKQNSATARMGIEQKFEPKSTKNVNGNKKPGKTSQSEAEGVTKVAVVSAEVVAKVNPGKMDNANSAVDNSVKYECTVCKKKFRSERQRDLHLETHGLGYECGVCLKILPTDAAYAEHRVSQHYVCNIGDCDYFFVSPNGVKFHMQRVHNLEPHYPCRYCDAEFKSSKPLYKHEAQCKLEHDATFKCENCEETVAVKDKKSHMSTCNALQAGSSSEVSNENYVCQFCKLECDSKVDKNDHEVNCYSNPDHIMTCKLCGKNFVGAMKLGQHLVHTHKQGSSLCIYCHHGFKDAASREKHYESCKPRILFKKENVPEDRSH